MYRADYVIVGAGAAGAVLASRLAEDKDRTVILIEAGPDNTDDPYVSTAAYYPFLWNLGEGQGPEVSTSHWGFMTKPAKESDKVYCYPRGTGLGGSVNHHAMIDGRGSALIYDQWAELTGDDIWRYDNLLHYFKKMEQNLTKDIDERFHGKNGWLRINNLQMDPGFYEDMFKTCEKEFGIPFIKNELNGDPRKISGIGYTDIQAHKDGRRSYVAKDLLLPTLEMTKDKGWNNLQILTDKFATKIIFEGKKAVGVEVLDAPRAYKVDAAHTGVPEDAKKFNIMANKEVILCGGSMNTPQLLMLSGIGPAEHLKEFGIPVLQDTPGVGSHLQDHLECGLIHKIDNLPNKYWRWQATVMSQKDPSFIPYSDPESVTGNAVPVTMEWHSGFEEPNMMFPDLHTHSLLFYYRDFNYNPAIHTHKDPGKGGYVKHFIEGIDPSNHVTYHTFLIELMKPKAEGSIRLQSTDPLDPPIVDLNLNHDEDLTRMAMGFELFRKIASSPLTKKYFQEEVWPGPQHDTIDKLKKFIAAYSSWGHHISGTAKMGGDNDPMAVLDSKCRVRGFEGLRVCDASIFPYIPGYNTSRASYMVGEVLADVIKSGE